MHDARAFFPGGPGARQIPYRLKRVEVGLASLRKELDTLTGQMRRAAILAALWAAAILANVASDRVAEFAVEAILSALKR